jgi:hypothetical protein
MANGVYNLNSGTFTEVGAGRYLKKFGADTDGVLAAGDFVPSQRGAGANRSVDLTAGDVLVSTIAGTSAYHAFDTAANNVATTTNASGNPRIDAISVYVDVAAFGATDNSGALKFKATAGTPGASPVAPSDATVQADVGAANPFHRVANVYLPNGYTQILNANNGTDGYVLDDSRRFAQTVDEVRARYRMQPEQVYTGLQPATSASLVSDISIGEAYVRGRYIRKDRTRSKTYTASKDTYVDIDNTGAFQFSEVANGAGEPAVASNSIRLAKAVTNGTAVTTVTDLRNLYASKRAIATGNVNLTTTYQALTGTSLTFSLSQASIIEGSFGVSVDDTVAWNVSDIPQAALIIDAASQLAAARARVAATDMHTTMTMAFRFTLASGAHTISLGAKNSTGNRGNANVDSEWAYHIWPLPA